MRHVHRRARYAAALLTLTLYGCEDAPTGPQVWTREAVGRMWVAVAEPPGLPGSRTWMEWAAPAAGDSVRSLLAAAARERRSGNLELALAREEAAAVLAAASLQSPPDAEAVRSAQAAVEAWLQRAAGPAASGRFPELARDRSAVAELAGIARARLGAGDALAASVVLTRAAGVARRWTPMAVAARALAQAEASIASETSPSLELMRARRLLQGAREGMASGEHARALQRAMYALQLLEHARDR